MGGGVCRVRGYLHLVPAATAALRPRGVHGVVVRVLQVGWQTLASYLLDWMTRVPRIPLRVIPTLHGRCFPPPPGWTFWLVGRTGQVPVVWLRCFAVAAWDLYYPLPTYLPYPIPAYPFLFPPLRTWFVRWFPACHPSTSLSGRQQSM